MNKLNTPPVSIIMRSYNDSEVIRGTLDMLKKQSFQDFVLWNFDSTSSDGTLDIIAEFNDPERIILNDPKSYNPGRILNEAMDISSGNIAVFINSDATPESVDWLENLIAPFSDKTVGAVYGRQTSRPDCRSLFDKDNERAFGDGSEAARWVHFFSMANSAVRRTAWETNRFETKVQYSEDIEWSYRIRKSDWRIVYAADAAAMHSHNYTLKESYKRHKGEGKADAWIFRNGEQKHSLLHYAILPFAMEVLRDMIWAIQKGSLDAMLHAVPLRFMQKWGRWKGLKEGVQDYVEK